ncbi:hypothetical protein NMH_0941 [Neisseria meningitidis H44/76]|uniref:Uncharacterized protein n=1 Tax=Neisseria meningitidis serogroup B / serotype 15 (strain H44/76) TaxID=909420 RepID=E6MWA1_NEIMH|nr:hypothetical protein NMH_0941 [Neisseria meningitidis H44/76]KER40838.1 hypothetical protein F528_0214 [Neisseria meningitidis 992008]
MGYRAFGGSHRSCSFSQVGQMGVNGLQYDLAESVFVTGFLIAINFLNRHFISLL